MGLERSNGVVTSKAGEIVVRSRIAFVLLSLLARGAAAQQSPFDFLDASYSATIVSNGNTGWISLGFLPDGRIVRSNAASTLWILDRTSTTPYHGDNMWSATTLHTSSYLAGYGMAYHDGYLYVNTQQGIRKIDPATGATTTLANSAVGEYGLQVTSDGKIIYNATDGWVHKYDLATSTDAQIYYSGTFNDDLSLDGAGNIFVAALNGCRVDILNPSGGVIQQVDVHSRANACADGITFSSGNLFASMESGDVDKFAFSGANYTGTVTESNIATGKACYGDFGGAGYDGSFYVNRFCQQYSDGTEGAGWSLIRIEPNVVNDNFGFLWDQPLEQDSAPEPATMLLMATGLAGVAAVARRRKVA